MIFFDILHNFFFFYRENSRNIWNVLENFSFQFGLLHPHIIIKHAFMEFYISFQHYLIINLIIRKMLKLEDKELVNIKIYKKFVIFRIKYKLFVKMFYISFGHKMFKKSKNLKHRKIFGFWCYIYETLEISTYYVFIYLYYCTENYSLVVLLNIEYHTYDIQHLCKTQ